MLGTNIYIYIYIFVCGDTDSNVFYKYADFWWIETAGAYVN